MKTIFEQLWMPYLSRKHRLVVWYFVMSLCMLCISDESPIWAIILVVLNFANSVRLVKKVPLPEQE